MHEVLAQKPGAEQPEMNKAVAGKIPEDDGLWWHKAEQYLVQFVLLMRHIAVRDGLGSVYRIVGTAQDITDRKLAELHSRTSTASMRCSARPTR